uniref:Uncharacterized protein n=1 Tax=Arundo donax TaxID=35708 RepID=A0A0A8YIW3_ARUDO
MYIPFIIFQNFSFLLKFPEFSVPFKLMMLQLLFYNMCTVCKTQNSCTRQNQGSCLVASSIKFHFLCFSQSLFASGCYGYFFRS